MGLQKHQLDKGFSCGDKTVCCDCISTEAISIFISNNQTSNVCSYCGSDEVIATSLESILELIYESVITEYSPPNDDGMSWDGREGGWQGITYNIDDVLASEGFETESEDLFKDVMSSFDDDVWCEKDHACLSSDRMYWYGWAEFSEYIKHTARYVFWQTLEESGDKEFPTDGMNPIDILQTLGRIINKMNLFKAVDTSEIIYRVRVVDPPVRDYSFEELGSPPNDYAKMPNRMSPAGISMFYGAFDKDTAICETYHKSEEEKIIVCGEFQPKRILHLIDLSDVVVIPSLFDEKQRSQRHILKFLHEFMEDFSREIDRTESSHIDYVPTQVVTEYLKYIFKPANNEQIDGILYPSSKTHRTALVLFFDAHSCSENLNLIGQSA